MYENLPQPCHRCRKLKEAHLGKFIKLRHRYNTKIWICLNCLDNPKADKGVQRRDSPPERYAKKVLMASGWHFVQNYKIESAFFDFAIPQLSLLIEIDSKSYHRYPRQKSNDRRKDALAAQNHWNLHRFRPGAGLENQISGLISSREAEIT